MQPEVEIWKDIEGYSLYRISDLGGVKRLEHHREVYRSDIKSSYLAFWKELILSPSKDSDGYLSVKLYNNGDSKNFLVHRLVAQAFINNPENKPTVNHINGLKNDNRVLNLEWSTGKEQSEHANKYNLVSEHLKMKKVLAYDVDGHFIEEFQSMKDAERALDILQARISDQCRGIRKTHCKGLFFEYSKT